MKIAALIPTFNGAECLSRALESVQAQSRPPDLVVVHDDASTDSTSEVLRGWGDRLPQLRTTRSPQNVGILRSRQRLIAECDADVLSFLDHDDAWPPDYLLRIEEVFSDRLVSACVTSSTSIVRGGRRLRNASGRQRLRRSEVRLGVQHIFNRYPVPTWSCLTLSRDAARRISELKGFPSGEEFALLALALELGDVVLTDNLDVERHISDSSASLNPSKQHEAELALLTWFVDRYPWLSPEVPRKVSSIYANSIYRFSLSGRRREAFGLAKALLRGLFHPKLLVAFPLLVIGSRALRWIRPTR